MSDGDKQSQRLTTPEQLREREYRRLKALADERNSQRGSLDKDYFNGTKVIYGDGIDCPKCLNRGFSMVVVYDGKRLPTLEYRWCDCSRQRVYARTLRESGLQKAVMRYRLDNFDAIEPWQHVMFHKAKQYIEHGAGEGNWFYAGGQSGSGKTHICTAIASELMKIGTLRYIVWPQTAKTLCGISDDAVEYGIKLNEIQTSNFLYIDDFFKPVFRSNGMEAMATAPEVRLAYDIINYRYNKELPTIISSEWFSSELCEIDEATAGRIAEACGEYKVDIARKPERNHRIRNEVI